MVGSRSGRPPEARCNLQRSFDPNHLICNGSSRGSTPERDIIVALETDEEIGDAMGLGVGATDAPPALIDAEFALNEGGRVGPKAGKPMWNSVQVAEKGDRGEHSSLPTKDNPIHRLAEALARLSKFSFPFKLNEITRTFFSRAAELENQQR